MSKMYSLEVPDYATLVDLVFDINQEFLRKNPDLKSQLEQTDNLDRISEERHGAIRIGKASELIMISRIFKIMGMDPVGYYDLTQANVPVHSTAFRCTDPASLARSPFRVFTSMLRTELISDKKLRKQSEEILEARDIFSSDLKTLVNTADEQGGLEENDAQKFIIEATNLFKWHEEASVDKEFYDKLKNIDPRAADIVCFKGPHINHLTPRTLDIDAVQREMPNRGIIPKNVVEGPPANCPVLLRQTSFKALTEKVYFNSVKGAHTARFGEIEQRSAALTPRGRKIYDKILAAVRSEILPDADGANANEYMDVLSQKFSEFTATPKNMREQKLAYFHYYVTEKGRSASYKKLPKDLDVLINHGYVDYMPIIYEDFLPVSAAGIFASNAFDKTRVDSFKGSSQEDFETALGRPVLDQFTLYKQSEDHSIKTILQELGVT